MKNDFLQQGDVLLFKVDSLPDDLKEVKSNELILAEGEMTGHMHKITEVKDAYMYLDSNNEKYLKVKKPVMLYHQEHKSFQIPSGLWKLRIVREYDHFAEEVRKVQD